MMSWLADNANTLYVLLAIIAVGLIAVWRSNQQAKFLLYAGGVLVLLIMLWLAVRYLPSDRKQLEDNVHAMADAVRDGNVAELLKHVSKDFRYKEMTREKLSALAHQAVRHHRVSEVRITNFEVSDLSRTNMIAKTRFRVTVWGDGEGQYMFVTEADFRLEGEQWKMLTMRFYPAFGGQDREIDLPGIR